MAEHLELWVEANARVLRGKSLFGQRVTQRSTKNRVGDVVPVGAVDPNIDPPLRFAGGIFYMYDGFVWKSAAMVEEPGGSPVGALSLPRPEVTEEQLLTINFEAGNITVTIGGDTQTAKIPELIDSFGSGPMFVNGVQMLFNGHVMLYNAV